MFKTIYTLLDINILFLKIREQIQNYWLCYHFLEAYKAVTGVRHFCFQDGNLFAINFICPL